MQYTPTHLTQMQIRQRLLDMFSLASSFVAIAQYGAMGIIRMVEEYLPLSRDIPLTEDQLEALDIFWRRVGQACDVTAYDIQMVDVLTLSPQWRDVQEWAAESLGLFGLNGPKTA
jgi:hypothetical protein